MAQFPYFGHTAFPKAIFLIFPPSFLYHFVFWCTSLYFCYVFHDFDCFPNSDSSLKGSSGVFRNPSDVLTGSRRVAGEVVRSSCIAAVYLHSAI